MEPTGLIIDVAQLGAGEVLPVKAVGPIALPEGFISGIKDALVDVHFEGSLRRERSNFTLGRIVAEGELAGLIPVLCSLCLVETRLEVRCLIREVYLREPADVDEWPISDNNIDLSSAFLANILSSLPMRVLCQEDCRGLCSICGGNKNHNGCAC